MNWVSTTKQSNILEGHYEMLNPLQALRISLANVLRIPEGGQGHMFHFSPFPHKAAKSIHGLQLGSRN
jgi:hypothetical protein